MFFIYWWSSTANFLIAIAANIRECQRYVRWYFRKVICLPSDWLDVAATYQSLPDKSKDQHTSHFQFIFVNKEKKKNFVVLCDFT
jgi:hypothetical protein